MTRRRRIFLGIVPPQVSLFGQEARPQPPMGLAYAFNGVAAAGWEPRLLDLCTLGYDNIQEDPIENRRVTGLSYEKALHRIAAEGPDAIGISMGVSTDHDVVKELCNQIRQAFPATTLIAGGPQASLMNYRLFEGYPVEKVPVDFVITGRDLGSGEEAICGLLRSLEAKEAPKMVPGLTWQDQGKLVTTPPVQVTELTLGDLSLPRRDLFQLVGDRDIYSVINRSHTGAADEVPYAVLHTSRGCGGACTFCHVQYAGFDNRLLRRALRNVRLELDYLREHGFRTISIEDDNFGGFSETQTEAAVLTLNEIRSRGFSNLYFPNGVTLRSMTNSNFLLLRTLREMADHGIRIRNSLPIECGSDETLRTIVRKPHNLIHVDKVLDELREGYLDHPNLEFDAFFMVGIVGGPKNGGGFQREKRSSIDNTMKLARRVADMGIRVNLWWMKPNPAGPQYSLWRAKFPEKPFHELQFLFPSGIWGDPDQEASLDEEIRAFNLEMETAGVGSRRPIYPVVVGERRGGERGEVDHDARVGQARQQEVRSLPSNTSEAPF